jgi:hypothetical protein
MIQTAKKHNLDVEKAMKAVALVVHLEEHEMAEFRKTATFCCERESEAALIRGFVRKKNEFAYDEPFVSIAVYRAGENICDSKATIYGDSDTTRKNCYVTLRVAQVLNRIRVVARDDFRQLATEIANRHKRNAPYASRLRQLKDLRRFSAAQRLVAIFWSTRNRGPHGYCLKLSDVESWNGCP